MEGPTCCSNFVSVVFQQPSEVHERQIVPSDSQVHDEGNRVSQEQQHDGCTRIEVNHTIGHGPGCAVVTVSRVMNRLDCFFDLG